MPDPFWVGAQICAVTANANRSKGPPAKVADFLPVLRPAGPRRRQSAEELRAAFLAATSKCKDP